jgi:urease accessory protein UreE
LNDGRAAETLGVCLDWSQRHKKRKRAKMSCAANRNAN